MPDSERCRSCKAPILWVHTTTGSIMPLDPEPVAGGNVALTGRNIRLTDDGPLRPEARVEPAGTVSLFDTVEHRVSHFATCPQADDWRTR